MLGISTDARATQNAFSVTMGGITYPLLSDFYPHGRVAQLYGIFNENQGTSFRTVMVVDKEGTVRFKRVYSDMSEFSTSDILAEVDKLQ
mgnify:CR=1 FL=1